MATTIAEQLLALGEHGGTREIAQVPEAAALARYEACVAEAAAELGPPDFSGPPPAGAGPAFLSALPAGYLRMSAWVREGVPYAVLLTGGDEAELRCVALAAARARPPAAPKARRLDLAALAANPTEADKVLGAVIQAALARDADEIVLLPVLTREKKPLVALGLTVAGKTEPGPFSIPGALHEKLFKRIGWLCRAQPGKPKDRLALSAQGRPLDFDLHIARGERGETWTLRRVR